MQKEDDTGATKDVLWFRRKIGDQYKSCKAHDESDNAIDNLWHQDVSSQHGKEKWKGRRES